MSSLLPGKADVEQEVTSIRSRFESVRKFTNRIVEPLSAEDCMVQSMPDVSPARWHLAHTTWFFETFLLSTQPGYQPFDPQFNFLFNSYYNKVGSQFPRSERGFISRPGLAHIQEYRQVIDERMVEWLELGNIDDDLLYAVEVGLNHEQQHQELMLTDIKHVLSCNPVLPAYQSDPAVQREQKRSETNWIEVDEGVVEIGHDGLGFCFDNELPRHRFFLEPFAISTAPMTNQDVIEFIEDGGYESPDHWLSMGWDVCSQEGWNAPMYWLDRKTARELGAADGWKQFTLGGLRDVDPAAPACHLSYFEADAIARWRGCRLPTEFEWEFACSRFSAGPSLEDQFADRLLRNNELLHPQSFAQIESDCQLMYGGVWEWTSSSYSAYPGYQPLPGALGEYNGKFMCNQYVLRGGSVATSHDHIRLTYRNFFPPSSRWQFSGCRLAKSR